MTPLCHKQSVEGTAISARMGTISLAPSGSQVALTRPAGGRPDVKTKGRPPRVRERPNGHPRILQEPGE